MTTETLTPERILEAAEDVLRRYGPAKANVVDVARALGVSHGSVYRHFPSKAALRDAVTERWLADISAPLAAVAARRSRARAAASAGSTSSSDSKRRKALDEPELFATYVELAAEAREVVKAHVDTLLGQLARIIADGVARGEFEARRPGRRGARGVRRNRPLPQPCPRRRVGRPRHRRRLRKRRSARPRRPHPRRRRVDRSERLRNPGEMKLPETARALIESGSLAHLVTLNPDGSPQVTCIWIGLDRDEIVSGHLNRDQRKLLNIARDPRVALSIEGTEIQPPGLKQYLVVHGRARVVEGGAPELLQRLAHIYLGPDVIFPPMADPPAGHVMHIAVERIGGIGPWAT